MAQPYDEDNVPTGDMPEGPPEEAAEGDNGQKVSQEQARYRKGSPVRCCGLCIHFEGAANGTCQVVNGQIVPYGVSDSFQIATNPWGPMIGPRERAIINQMAQTPPDQSPFVRGAVQGGPPSPPMPMPPAAAQASPVAGGPPQPAPPSGLMDMMRPTSPMGMRIGRQGYAGGGRPRVGTPVTVGEEGPELFVPDVPGTIVPTPRPDPRNPVMEQRGYGERPRKTLPETDEERRQRMMNLYGVRIGRQAY